MRANDRKRRKNDTPLTFLRRGEKSGRAKEVNGMVFAVSLHDLVLKETGDGSQIRKKTGDVSANIFDGALEPKRGAIFTI